MELLFLLACISILIYIIVLIGMITNKMSERIGVLLFYIAICIHISIALIIGFIYIKEDKKEKTLEYTTYEKNYN